MIASDDGEILAVLHPYFIHHNPMQNTIMMMPYCVFTDNILYMFPKAKLKFVVPASSDVASRFVKMVSAERATLDAGGKSVIEGNDTKH